MLTLGAVTPRRSDPDCPHTVPRTHLAPTKVQIDWVAALPLTSYALLTHIEVEIRQARGVRIARGRQAGTDCIERASAARALPRLAGGVAPARRVRREAATGKVRVRTRRRLCWRLPPAADRLNHGDAFLECAVELVPRELVQLVRAAVGDERAVAGAKQHVIGDVGDQGSRKTCS